MLHYRGITFCAAPCRKLDCDIRLSDEVEAGARAWWGKDGAPISVGNRSARCPDYQPNEEEDLRGAA